jgi:Pyruvate/2-oxoacid:ferredoxin oxidoreductase gamma subunit
MVANMVALGAAVAATGMVSLVDVIQALWVHSTEEPELLKMDQSALQQGAELAQAVAR